MHKTLLFLSSLLTFTALAEPNAPILRVNSQGIQVKLNWSDEEQAQGYRLLYAPFPYQGSDSIASIDMGSKTEFEIDLWQNAKFFVAVQAYDSANEASEFSNIGFLQIEDRGEDYRDFWLSIAKDNSEEIFSTDDFLYTILPQVDSCMEGLITDQAKLRELETLNQTRALHKLKPVEYDINGDIEVQEASLIQRANNFLTHTPSENSTCFNLAALSGSLNSNLGLTSGNEDPAQDIISLVDDAFNIADVARVGHRRHFLNPFLQFTSYGQVFGASSIKVVNFSDDSTVPSSDIPDFVAFPYLRYPYLFFSDKRSNKKTPWNISLIEDKSSVQGNQLNFFSGATISVIQKDNNRELTVTNINSDIDGFGIPNNLSWMVDDWQYDTWYSVKIDNINSPLGETNTIQYDVFIDFKNFFDLAFPLEIGDQQNQTSIQGFLPDQLDKDSYQVNLQGTVTFLGSSQFSNLALFIAVYDSNKELILASDESFTIDLANDVYTIVVSNCHNQTCYDQEKEYSIQIN